MKTVVTSLCVLSLLQAAPQVALADDEQAEQARRYFLEGKQAYTEGRYHAAIASFRAAAAIRPSPILEFNVARCFEKLGKLEEAIAAYEKYLAASKDAANRAEVKARVSKLKEERRRQRSKDPYEDIERGGTESGAVKPPVPPPPVAAPASRPAASRPYAAAPPARPPQQAARAEAEPAHEASLPRSWGHAQAGAGSAPPAGSRRPATPPAAPPRQDATPVYKQWWFWVACVGGAALAGLFITTAVYASGGGSSSNQPRALVSW